MMFSFNQPYRSMLKMEELIEVRWKQKKEK